MVFGCEGFWVVDAELWAWFVCKVYGAKQKNYGLGLFVNFTAQTKNK
jgi:hypothetical protein